MTDPPAQGSDGVTDLAAELKTLIANAAYVEGHKAAQNEARVATNPTPPEEGVRLTGEFVAKRNPDGEIEHHFNSEGDADVLFAATPEAIPLTGPVEILIRPLSESNE